VALHAIEIGVVELHPEHNPNYVSYLYPPTISPNGSRHSAPLQGQRAADYQVPLAEHSIRFGISHTIISDNGMNFASKHVASFCAKYITHRFSSPYYHYYPLGNGQAKISNCTILDNLCKNMNKAKGKWAKKLPRALWALQDHQMRPDQRIPFSLAYETEAIIPVDISMLTFRVGVIPNQMLDHSKERRHRLISALRPINSKFGRLTIKR